MITCAHCSGKFCRTGDLSNAPANCPSRTTTHEENLQRYEGEDLKMARVSAAVEGRGYCKRTRIEEIMEFAIGCGYRHLGVAFCTGLSTEALTFVEILRRNGFEVDSVCCKNGSVPKEAIGIPREDRVRPQCEFEAMCNPAGQAAILNACGTELNILCGLCVGHDTLFIKNSDAPVTVFAVKDRVTGHNPLAPIYTANSYYARVYDYVKNREDKPYQV